MPLHKLWRTTLRTTPSEAAPIPIYNFMNLFITILLLMHVIGSCMPSCPYGTRYALAVSLHNYYGYKCYGYE